MKVKITSIIKEVFTVAGITTERGNKLHFKNGITYVDLDEENAGKLKEMKLDERYKDKIIIEYEAIKDEKKDEKQILEMIAGENIIEELKEEMQKLNEELESKTVPQLKAEYQTYISTGATKKDDIIKSIIENIYKEKKAEIEGKEE